MRHETEHRARKYLRRLTFTAILWVAFCIVFTVCIDPYRMYGTPTVRGWTELKPRIYQQGGLAKATQLERMAPRTVLLGNSRVEIGFNPNSKIWRDTDQPVFNAAEAGKGLPTAVAMLREDIAVRVPHMVLVGLDFQDFLSRQDLASARQPPPGPDERRLLVDRQGRKNRARPIQVWRDRFATTLTIDALSDSVLTILDQDATNTVTMTQAGFNPLHEYRLYAHRTGYYDLFLAKAKDYEHQYSTFALPDFSDPANLGNFRDLATIVSLAKKYQIQLIFFTQPYHADYLEMLHRLGFWPSFEQWKRTLVQFAGTAGVPLYDFADYNDVTTEPVPQAGDTSSDMHWYWEPGHYKEALGDRMLNAMITRTTSFGRRLTATNVEGVIAEIRAERTLYLPQRDEIARTLY